MHILCFGDSNTYGYDPRSCSGGRYSPEHRWVDLLAEKTGWKVCCLGENGRTVPTHPTQIEQVQRILAAHAAADLFAVMLGTNDLLQGAAADQIAMQMDDFLQSILPHCRRALLIAPPPMTYGDWVTTPWLLTESALLADAYRQLARRLGIDFADAVQWNVELAYDGVHFSEAGHSAFAQCLQEFLETKPL